MDHMVWLDARCSLFQAHCVVAGFLISYLSLDRLKIDLEQLSQ